MVTKRFNRNDIKNLNELNGGAEINQNHLILRFIDFDFNPDEITNRLKLKPLSIGRQGEEYFIGKRRMRKIWEFNHWDYEIKTKTNDFIGDTISDFFNEIIIPRIETIKEISQSCMITRFVIVQYYYTGCNPGYAFDKGQIKVLADINAEIDMDIYCLSDD